MRAARRFLLELREREFLEDVEKLQVELYGSLAMTGKGHATDVAVMLGLEGETPEGIDPDSVMERVRGIEVSHRLQLFGRHGIGFNPQIDLIFHRGQRLPFHSNGMRFKAFRRDGRVLHAVVYYSVGGGFVVSHKEATRGGEPALQGAIPYPFRTCEELLGHCRASGKSIPEVVWANETARRSPEGVREGILRIWDAMQACVERGLRMEGELPGGLGVQRRAAALYRALVGGKATLQDDPTLVLEWVSVYALAVNEENAAGGRVVTAPTNGASGILPAVLHYCKQFVPRFDEEDVVNFFLTASAMAILYKEGASLSAAEMGCQGEVGVACSMAAAGLAAVLGGTNEQIERAAEIGMEHNLGLTCDPVGGLVQIPCIERNTMGAVQAINAARLALRGNGEHRVSLDACIRAMREIGDNMKSLYKETSEGGLAIQVPLHVPAC